MVRITPINNKKTVFGDLRIGDYFLITGEYSCYELFIKESNAYGLLLSNGESLVCSEDLPITHIKNVSIEYEV